VTRDTLGTIGEDGREEERSDGDGARSFEKSAARDVKLI
jgi:hypothetical protein